MCLRYASYSASAAAVYLRVLKSAVIAAVAFGAKPAHADVSSWIYVGGGASHLSSPDLADSEQGVLQLDTGFGTSPQHPLVVGFAAKTMTHFGHGTDLGLALRTTTRGYSLGDWGAALDVGGLQRFWGPESTGLLSASVSLGLPWGFTLAATGASDWADTNSLVLTLGLDWARLTVHRTVGDRWWRNYRLPVADRDTALNR